ncbi:orotate phosphoribosyltransferase [bacterium]|nr:orotate phosphoribosyltransferase [bacterium]
MDRQALLRAIKSAAYLEGDFVTRAGNKTSYYIDKYLFETDPSILGPLADFLVPLLPPLDSFDRLAAPELGAVSIAAVLSVRCNKPFVIVKKQTKDYGTQRLIEGRFSPGDRMVIIEDILTTGGAALRALDVLRQQGVSVSHIVGVINREEGAFDNIVAQNVVPSALFSKTDLQSC